MTSELANRYAQGLFSLAEDEGTVEEKKEACEALLEVLDQCPDFLMFLQAVRVTEEEKKAMICKVFSGRLDQDMVHFLELLVDRGRTYYLREMLQAYIVLANEKLGIETAEVSSARKLSKEDLERIRKALETKTGKQIVLKNQVDPKLIAGIKVRIGNQVTDATMKTRIEGLRESLLKGGLA